MTASAGRTAEMIDRTRRDEASVELAARRHEAASLSAALRVVARGIEAYALDNRGDMRQVQWAETLRGIADRNDRRWTDAA